MKIFFSYLILHVIFTRIFKSHLTNKWSKLDNVLYTITLLHRNIMMTNNDNKQKVEEKIGEALGLEMAAQKAVEELGSKRAIR
jgi:hypothetical protein